MHFCLPFVTMWLVFLCGAFQHYLPITLSWSNILKKMFFVKFNYHYFSYMWYCHGCCQVWLYNACFYRPLFSPNIAFLKRYDVLPPVHVLADPDIQRHIHCHSAELASGRPCWPLDGGQLPKMQRKIILHLNANSIGQGPNIILESKVYDVKKRKRFFHSGVALAQV